MKKMRFGMSSCGFPDLTEENFKDMQEAGVSELEVSISGNFNKNQNIDWQGIKEKADRYGINLWSYHLPFVPFEEIDISSPKENLRLSTVAEFKKLIEKAVSIGIKIIIIHPSGEPYTEDERKPRLECAKRSLKELAEYADKLGAVIAVEDLPRTCLGRDSSDIKNLISVDSRLKVCFDTNHLLAEPLSEFIKAIGDKFITTHVSDYDFKDERHWLPGEGDIDWSELIGELEKVGYDAPLLYEVYLEAPDSIKRERTLNFSDFKENHKSLLKKEKPKALGIRKENL